MMKKNLVTRIVTVFFTAGVLVGCGSQDTAEITTEYGTEDTSAVEAAVEESAEVVEEATAEESTVEEEPKTEIKWVNTRECKFVDQRSYSEVDYDYNGEFYVRKYDGSGNKVEEYYYVFVWTLDNEDDTLEKIAAEVNDLYEEGNLEEYLNSACTYEYDEDSIKAIYKSGYVATYDKNGNWISQTDDSGNVSILFEYEYDDKGNVVKRTDVEASMGDVTYEYDENNNLVTEYKNDKVYTYEYDKHNNKVSRSRTEDGVTEVLNTYDNEYDDNNNLIKVETTIGSNLNTTIYMYESIEVPVE